MNELQMYSAGKKGNLNCPLHIFSVCFGPNERICRPKKRFKLLGVYETRIQKCTGVAHYHFERPLEVKQFAVFLTVGWVIHAAAYQSCKLILRPVPILVESGKPSTLNASAFWLVVPVPHHYTYVR